jgi:4a-hydroxytetrahydrobiopterin dehydratase
MSAGVGSIPLSIPPASLLPRGLSRQRHIAAMNTHRPHLLAQDDVERLLPTRPLWRQHGAALVREVAFPGFEQAFAFMTAAARVAEALDHHPDWRNVYNRVWITLSTHDAGGITTLDFELAASMDALIEPLVKATA